MPEVLCPYCNELLPDVVLEKTSRHADNMYFDGDSEECTCPSCGKTICVRVAVHISFSVEKVEEDL